MKNKKILEEYLKESAFDQFISAENFTLIDNSVIQLKSSIEISDKISFFVIVEGHMDVFFPDKNGKNHLMARIYPKDCPLGGLPKYFNKKYNNTHNFVASLSKDARLYEIDSKKITKLLKTPEFLEFIFEKFFTFSSQIIRENYFRSIFTLEEYLAYILYYHSEDSEYVVVNYSTFANLLKCDRTNLYRSLTSLENQNLIKKDKKKIEILSMEDLKYLFEEKL